MLNFADKSLRTNLMAIMPVLVLTLALGCASKDNERDMSEKKMKDMNWEEKKFAVASGSSADGSINLKAFFKETGEGIKVKLWVNGLQPNAVHAVHIHENGVCNQPDFTSAGSHFDPAGTDLHGAPEMATSHLGDLGNVTAGPDGQGRSKLNLQGATLTEGSTNVVGRSIILHAGPDDFTTQPSGASGGRLACAVIELGDMEKLKELKKDGLLKEWKAKDKKRKGKMDRMKKKKADPKPPELEQKPEQKPDGPGSATDAEI